ncbi:ABC transporter ATP-binding protein [Streptomyces europaeiscabiei]|uniref:ABC transporter ATP-binding protein n=1 Tax=Streptomyces europaeiscabiei TaxID=146819 RepID=UPI0029A76C48|nr:ABC transporter ATP-binding protein [Streptomyces europaeiscabiei]MDX3637553.1 ABC transporter ATP-binding protein [Streptomyces europaeiscabiei]MDX3655440.1 ABC transporter ATP-binding protein [Streptomyces europaeiscabiei]WUD35567.1 ABC transporter ATP-binding protein/permease [Streptomyces europaeiscabiei]
MINAHEDPGTPDCRSGSRYLWWLVRQQAGRSALGSLISCVWMILLAATPYLLSRAIDEGLEPGDHPALAGWTAALFGVGAFNAWLSVMRHRTMTRVRMDANFRTVKVVVAHAVRLGAALPRRVGAGEVVTIGVGDVNTISSSLTVIGPGVGAFAAYLVVAGLLVSVSLPIAAVVLLGMPLMVVIVGPLMRRLQGTETEYRERQGVLTARIADLAGGLRVLNGLGGKGLVADAFHRDSQRLRAQGYRVGAVTSWMQALGVGLPTLFLAVVTWLAARLAAQGAITVGELVAVYGYVTVLVRPVSYFVAWGYEVSRGVVAARRVIRFVTLEPLPDHGTTDAPAEPSALHDPESGVRVPPGRLVALAADRPAEAAAVVDRLGRYAPTAATWGRTPLDAIPLAQVRARILVADHEADLFAGRLRDLLGGHGDVDDATAARALRAAVAEDIVQGLSDGLDSAIDARGRNLSGGQRQRVRLARALVADPEILLAVEPTSALDAHTEARVAQRLRAAREGRTTLVTTTSPLVLDHADTVLHLVEGKVAAVGTHRELLAGEAGYRALVARDAGEEDGPGEEDATGQEDGSGQEADPTESTVEEVAR